MSTITTPSNSPAEQQEGTAEAERDIQEVVDQTGEALDAMSSSNEVEVSSLNISTIDQVIQDSIVQKTDNDYIALKDGVDINSTETNFTVNTVTDDLKLRSETGAVINTVPRGIRIVSAQDFKIFKLTDQNNIKILMVKVNVNGQEGYLAAPYLKLHQPTTSETTPDAPATNAPPVTTEDQPTSIETAPAFRSRLLATSMTQVAGVGDSIGEGMHSAGFSNINFQRGRTTSRHLQALRQLLQDGTINAQNTKSFILYGAGNNFSATQYNPNAATRAAADFAEMIRLLKAAGIQPVVCTMFIGLSDNRATTRSLSQEQIRSHPRYRSIMEFNQKMRELAQSEGIPLLDMHSLTSQNPSYLVHPGRNFYRQMTGLIESSLSTA